MTSRTHKLGVGDSEATSLEDGREHLLRLGFEGHELTLAERLREGSVVVLSRLDVLARRSRRRKKPLSDTDRTVVALLQDLEELRLQVYLYLRTFGSPFVSDGVVLDADGRVEYTNVRPNPSVPSSLNETIREKILRPNASWFADFYRRYGDEIRKVCRSHKTTGPTVTATTQVISRVTA